MSKGTGFLGEPVYFCVAPVSAIFMMMQGMETIRHLNYFDFLAGLILPLAAGLLPGFPFLLLLFILASIFFLFPSPPVFLFCLSSVLARLLMQSGRPALHSGLFVWITCWPLFALFGFGLPRNFHNFLQYAHYSGWIMILSIPLYALLDLLSGWSGLPERLRCVLPRRQQDSSGRLLLRSCFLFCLPFLFLLFTGLAFGWPSLGFPSFTDNGYLSYSGLIPLCVIPLVFLWNIFRYRQISFTTIPAPPRDSPIPPNLPVEVHKLVPESTAPAATGSYPSTATACPAQHKRDCLLPAFLPLTGDSLILVNPDFRIDWTGGSIPPVLTPSGPDLRGMELLDYFYKNQSVFADDKRVFQFIKKLMTEPATRLTGELLLKDERSSRFQVLSTPFFSPDGDLEHLMLIFRDITFHHAMEARLLAKNQELESFVHTVSHDLKNPIAVILGVADLMSEQFQSFLDRDGEEYVRMLKEESHKMLQLIDDMLQIARIEQRRFDWEDVDTLAVVNFIVAEYQHIYRDVPVVFIIQESLPVVHANSTMLTQVFKNLISNAVKYSDPAKPRAICEIGYALRDGFHHFSVQDNGLGMTPEDLAKVFDLFFRVGEKEVEGTGLGTSIIQKIVNAHGGKVIATSQKGSGSTFTFTLPVIPVDSASGQPTSSLD